MEGTGIAKCRGYSFIHVLRIMILIIAVLGDLTARWMDYLTPAAVACSSLFHHNYSVQLLRTVLGTKALCVVCCWPGAVLPFKKIPSNMGGWMQGGGCYFL